MSAITAGPVDAPWGIVWDYLKLEGEQRASMVKQTADWDAIEYGSTFLDGGARVRGSRNGELVTASVVKESTHA